MATTSNMARWTIAGGLLAVATAVGVCIRPSDAAAPSGRYVLSGGTVRDTKTELVWELDVGPGTVPYRLAPSQCADLTLADSTWRLPSIKELQTLIDPSGPPYLDTTAFDPLMVDNQYWTSSLVVGSTSQELWTVGWNTYNNNYPSVQPRDPDLEAVVRCVRVGPRPPSDGGVDAPRPPITMFKEDFEDGVFDGWTLGTNPPSTSPPTYTITDATAAGGSTRSLEIRGTSGWYAGPNQMFGPFQPARASFWIRATNIAGAGTGAFALTANGTASQIIARFFLQQTSFTFDGAGQISTFGRQAPELGRWYHIEIELNWPAHTFVGKVDGVVVGETAFESNSPAMSVARLDIFNATGGTTYFDEIEIGP